jgi:hypothetical protein
LRLLERRTARFGRDSVEHGPSGADDHANVVFGAMWLLAKGSNVALAGPNVIVFRGGSPDPLCGDPSAEYNSITRAGGAR